MNIKPPKDEVLFRICAKTKSGKIVNIDSYWKSTLRNREDIPRAIYFILDTYPEIKREDLVVFRQEWVEETGFNKKIHRTKNKSLKKMKKPTRPRFKHGSFLAKYIQVPYFDRFLIIQKNGEEMTRLRLMNFEHESRLYKRSLLYFLREEDFKEDKTLSSRLDKFFENIDKYNKYLDRN